MHPRRVWQQSSDAKQGDHHAKPGTAPNIFPGKVITFGSTDTVSIRAIQSRLNNLGCGPVEEDGVFGVETADAIELFQSRSVDKFDIPLKVDGQVGPITWGALFATGTLPTVTTPPSTLLGNVIEFAKGEIGTMESPIGSNRAQN